MAVDWEPEQLSRGSKHRWRATWRAGQRAAVLLALAVFGVGCLSRSEAGAPLPPDQGVVVEVIDGDTVALDIGGRTERVRLLGIDAPESVHPSVPVQCFGPEASAELAALLPTNTPVRVERDHELRDRFDRLLLYVYRLADDLFVNHWLVANGLADTTFYEPNITHVVSLTEARSTARSGGVGLWSSCDGPDQPLE